MGRELLQSIDDWQAETRKVTKAEYLVSPLNIVHTAIKEIESYSTNSNEQTNTQSSDIHQIIDNIRDESLTPFTDGERDKGLVIITKAV